MSNASKALMMAGGVLISLMIIGVAIYMYNGIIKAKAQEDITAMSKNILKINGQIEAFTNASKIYGSNVLSLCNLIEDYRTKYVTSEGYPEILMEIKIDNNSLLKWDELCGKTLEDYKLLAEYNLKVDQLKQLGDSYVGHYDYLGTVEFLAGLQYEELELYIYSKCGEENQYLYEQVINKVNQYQIMKSVLTEFKNKEFECKEIKYDDNTKIIYKIVYETKT